MRLPPIWRYRFFYCPGDCPACFLAKWPGVIKPGTISNDLISHEDWLPTLMAAAGSLDLEEAQAKGWTVVDMKNEWKIIYPFEKK